MRAPNLNRHEQARSILHAPKRSCLPHFFGCFITYAHVVRDKHKVLCVHQTTFGAPTTQQAPLRVPNLNRHAHAKHLACAETVLPATFLRVFDCIRSCCARQAPKCCACTKLPWVHQQPNTLPCVHQISAQRAACADGPPPHRGASLCVRDAPSAVRAPNYLGCTNNQTRSLACTKSQQACMRSILHAPKRSCLPQSSGVSLHTLMLCAST